MAVSRGHGDRVALQIGFDIIDQKPKWLFHLEDALSVKAD